jgi:hypothetical protein
MDYRKHYQNLIATRKRRQLQEGEYYERHHIIPKCMNGNNDKNNLVVLTAKEHYIAHWLLVKIYPENWKLKFAFYKMSKTNSKQSRIISSSQYQRSKKYYSEGCRQRMIEWNPGKSENSRRKASQRMSSAENPMIKYPEKNPFLGKSYVAGRKFYNNGVKNLYLKPGDPIPEGYVLGMAPYKRIHRGKISNHGDINV